MPIFTALRTPNPDQNSINLATVIRELQKPLLGYKEIDVTVNGETVVNHLLNRQPSGWIVVDKLDFGDILRISWDSKTVTLDSASSVRCKILFY